VTFLLIVAAVAMIVMAFQRDSGSSQRLTINEVARDIQAGKVARVVISDDDSLRVIYANGSEDGVESYKESNSTLVDQLLALGVSQDKLTPESIKIEVKPPSQWAGIVSGALYILPVIFMAGVLWFIFRQAQGSNNAAMSFGKSRARMFSGEHPTVSFQDVAGV
jgi:cell division protease FtsH